VEPDRHAQLLGVALRSLVADRTGELITAESASLGRGVALVHGDAAWVLIDTRHDTALGPSLAWALRHDLTVVHLMSDAATGVLSRRAAGLRPESITVDVCRIDGRKQIPAIVEPLGDPATPTAEHLAFSDLIEQAGADVVVEHGVVAGEVAGLEVCRVLTDSHTGAVRLEVGVGAHDRETFAMLHGDVPLLKALTGVVDTVAAHRRPGAEPHPLNRLGRERLVRHGVVEHPERLGLAHLSVAQPPVPRPNLKDPVPCVAYGADLHDQPVVVVFSSGIDLDVVPFALDSRAALDPTATVLIALEERDALALQHRLAALAQGDVRIAVLPVHV
jgi:hypothetical protein